MGLAVASALFVASENGGSPYFQACVGEHAAKDAQRDAKEKNEVVAIFRVVGTQSVCTVRFLDRHNGSVAAGAGIAVALFTWILWQASRDAIRETQKQIQLGRDEFNATHRPWLAIRGAAVGKDGKAGVELGPLQLEIDITYTLENTSDVPVLDLLLYGSLIKREGADNIIPDVIRHWIDAYEHISTRTKLPKPQNQVVWPHETMTYRSPFAVNWRDFETGDVWTSLELGDVLVVAVFVYVSPFDKADFKISTCVHRVTSSLSDNEVEVAKAGTGVILDGHVSRWRTGWSAA